MRIGTSVALLLAAGALTPAFGDDLGDTMRAWCTQTGTWQGSIDITDAAGHTQKVSLVSRHRCTPDGRLHIVEEDFVTPQRSDHTLKVTYADPSIAGFRTAYFFRGGESPHAYRVAAVAFRDELHWKQSITTADESELFENRKAVMRYTRERDGDRIVSRKEVRFQGGKGDFETRTLIEQRRVQP